MDIVADQPYNESRFRALTVVDNLSRKCLSIYAGEFFKGNDAVEVRDNLVPSARASPEGIKVDSDSGSINQVLDKWAYGNNVGLDFSMSGKPKDNP